MLMSTSSDDDSLELHVTSKRRVPPCSSSTIATGQGRHVPLCASETSLTLTERETRKNAASETGERRQETELSLGLLSNRMTTRDKHYNYNP